MSAAAVALTSSRELYEKACAVLPGGVNSPVRAMGAIGRTPPFVVRGDGAELHDVDGNVYVDWVCSWGPLILGHAHPDVVAAIVAAAHDGTTFGAPTPGEVRLAEEVRARVPGAEMMRMTSSGTEAAMTALRLARAATGRDRVLKFAGHYHGHSDSLLAQAGSGLATQGLPSSPGVPAAFTAATTVAPWGDRDALAAATAGQDLSAIIAEPLPANMGLVPAPDGFLELLRQRADACGALLIFDEVISGFRVDAGGMVRRTGVRPDLVTLGKVLGGGLPAGAVVGRRELMSQLAPAGPVYQAGTLSGNPLAVAGALATLKRLDDDAYARLAAVTDELASGLRGAVPAGLPVQVISDRGLLTVFFSAEPVRNFADAQACDHDAYAAWCRALLAGGVYAPPSQYEAWFPSLAHTSAHVSRTVEVAAAAFAAVAEQGP